MTVRRGANKWAQNEQVKSVDLNDTLGSKNVKVVQGQYLATMDDDLIVLKPSSAPNTFLPVPITGTAYIDMDLNFAKYNNTGYFVVNTGSQNVIGRINLSTGTTSLPALANFGPNGYTAMVADATYMYWTNYTSAVQRVNLSTNTNGAFATCPAQVYALARDENTGHLYAQAYGGTIYKITTAGVVTTHFTGGSWGSNVCAMTCDNAGTLYISNGANSWKITQSGVVTQTSTTLPATPYFYNSGDQSIYYKKSGQYFIFRYDIATDVELPITTGQYASGGACFTDGTYLYEGQDGTSNLCRIAISTMIQTAVLSLPTPSADNKGKELIVSSHYGFTSAPFIAGKMLIDRNPTNTNNTLSLMTMPYTAWGTTIRSIRLISDGDFWLAFRN